MKTLKDILTLSCDYVKSKKNSFSRRDVEDLIAFVLQIKRLDLYLKFDRPLEENELQKIREGLKRLVACEPIQYIEGAVQFLNCSIQVTPSVLIPRPETELLVEKIISELKNENLQGKVLLDLCCGSGCIGIAIKKHLPALDVLLIDKSEPALKVAHENAKLNQTEVTLLHGDLFAPLLSKKVDFLISNPPYIARSEYEGLDPSVKLYEPEMALISGDTGLELYERIAKEYQRYVLSRAWLEIGASQGSVLRVLFQETGCKSVKLEQDLSGHDRFLNIHI